MAPGGNDHAAVGIARLQSDLEHLSSTIEKLSRLVIDDGESSLAMRVVLLERGLADLRRDMDLRLGSLMDKLSAIELLLERQHAKPALKSDTEHALVESNKALVESNKALSSVQTEGVKGKWAVALAFASGFTGAMSALVTAWLKAKFGA